MPSPAKPGQASALLAPVRWGLLALALLFVALGVIGIFLPVLPTVPFLLLAAWAAARSSPRLLAWLEGHPHLGSLIRDWREAGVVRRRTKWNATIAMGASAVIILLTVRKPWVAGLAIASMATVLAWLWRRPEREPE
jgi:uncharacterized membrane protein YbaN (DUF454 family)